MTGTFLRLALVAFLTLSLVACGTDDGAKPAAAKGTPAPHGEGKASAAAPGVATETPAAPAPEDPTPGKTPMVVLETTQGPIKIELFPDKAPEHVKNFLTHARNGYYDGTYFHRCYRDFMIQGGDPNTRDQDRSNDGLGGYSYKGSGTFLRAEFNDTHHVRGILSMARSNDPNSAGSQFFIMVSTNLNLDGQYTAFGRVLEGMDVADRIVNQPGDPLPAGGVNPTVNQRILKARVLE